jgi:antitoxin component YwqK of YwqJK toxin-antitoxin module
VSASALALALALSNLPPLACPPGTEHRGAQPLEGYEEWCEAPDPGGRPRREGPARTFYDDGELWLESSYREGLLHGPYLERYRGGVPAREGAYEKGNRVGTWRAWYADGTLQEVSTWRAGQADGAFIAYWPSGTRKEVGRHCLGAQCGVWRAYDEEGRELGVIEYGGDWRAQP